MSRYTISQSSQPTQEEFARWAREAEYFSYREPNSNAPSSSSVARGWGVPRDYKPPVDAVDHVTAVFKRDVAAVSQETHLRPEFFWSIFSVCMAHFLWFRTEAGAEWILRFFGTERIPPFTEGYVYFYLSKNPNGGEPTRIPIDEGSGIEMRIYRACERELDPPITSRHDETIVEMQGLLKKARDPNATELIAEASPDMYFWVSEQLREWFLEPQANLRWPTPKPTRMTGHQWAKTLERRPGVLFYEALHYIELFKGRAYRLKDRQGGVMWCGGSGIRFMLKPDYLKSEQIVSDHLIEGRFRCSSCGKMRPCTPVTKDQRMCCHCMGSIVETGNRPTLNWCTMRECKHCPDHIENKSDLINLKNRLNKEAPFPVNR